MKSLNIRLTWCLNATDRSHPHDAHPDVDPQYVNFVDLRKWVMALDGFVGEAERCGEKVLEAIQMAWLDERD